MTWVFFAICRTHFADYYYYYYYYYYYICYKVAWYNFNIIRFYQRKHQQREPD